MGFILHNFYGGKKAAFLVQLQTLRMVTCDNIITLNAQIIGFAGTSKFRWEQTSGQPVVFLEDQNQTMVTFQQTQIRDDKTFIFYVNKGTTLEQKYTVLVTAIPRDTVLLQTDTTARQTPFWQAELAAFSLYPPIVADGTAKYVDYTDATDRPLVVFKAGRATPSFVLTTYSYGVRKELINPTPYLQAGQIGSVSAKADFDKRSLLYIEQGVQLDKTDPPSWVMKSPVPNVTLNTGATTTESMGISRDIHGASKAVAEWFLTKDAVTGTETIGLSTETPAGGKVVAEWFLTRTSLAPIDEPLSLQTTMYSSTKTVATNFIDKSSIG